VLSLACAWTQALLWQAALSPPLRSRHRRTAVLPPRAQTRARLRTELRAVAHPPDQVHHGACALELCCWAYVGSRHLPMAGLRSVVTWVVDEGVAWCRPRMDPPAALLVPGWQLGTEPLTAARSLCRWFLPTLALVVHPAFPQPGRCVRQLG